MHRPIHFWILLMKKFYANGQLYMLGLRNMPARLENGAAGLKQKYIKAHNLLRKEAAAETKQQNSSAKTIQGLLETTSKQWKDLRHEQKETTIRREGICCYKTKTIGKNHTKQAMKRQQHLNVTSSHGRFKKASRLRGSKGSWI